MNHGISPNGTCYMYMYIYASFIGSYHEENPKINFISYYLVTFIYIYMIYYITFKIRRSSKIKQETCHFFSSVFSKLTITYVVILATLIFICGFENNVDESV